MKVNCLPNFNSVCTFCTDFSAPIETFEHMFIECKPTYEVEIA